MKSEIRQRRDAIYSKLFEESGYFASSLEVAKLCRNRPEFRRDGAQLSEEAIARDCQRYVARLTLTDKEIEKLNAKYKPFIEYSKTKSGIVLKEFHAQPIKPIRPPKWKK